ncbi:hypothetical protein EG349_18135 [Chryseobacterium shandongense]|uniref:Uncharacterized protein n=1 Tax=Chryseobacterium shandongense TaxID=1493872 RepID=A0AAD0YIU0_9FLAO|nr:MULTISPECIES: hypothetical protein [Chryseobacterium]AZA88553.1 hypothetical protein EG349_18135 [Chryseobacterium shandongense]AZA97095.1 hypothetical protein EG353_16835 [Chryseobacterium shandongense]OCK52056.1 hypothetical protein BA768_14105 [Chryseobacterium sp. CBo1]
MNATKNNIGKNTTTRRAKTAKVTQTIRRVSGMDEAAKRCIGSPKRPTPIGSDKTASNGFLKTTFLPKFKENDFQKSISKEDNLIKIQRKKSKTERDFYKSLSQLAGHYGLNPIPTENFDFPYNIALSVWNIKKQLKESNENWDNIQLIQNENRTYFISEERCKTGTSLFYIPLIPLYRMLKNKAKKKSAQLLLSVCSYLYRNANIPYYRQENSYLYWNYEMLTDWISEDEEIDENHSSKKELQQAEIIGDFMEQKIFHKNNVEVFGKRLETFKAKNNFDKECFQLSKKVFQLYNDYPEESIFRNAHFNNIQTEENTDDDFYNEEKVVTMDKYISFFADDKGLIYQNLIDSVNNDFNEYSELQEPMITKVFDGSDIPKNNLDFENRLFGILIQLSTLLGD